MRPNRWKVLALVAALGGATAVPPLLASAQVGLPTSKEVAAISPPQAAIELQMSMRSDIGLRDDEESVRTAFAKAEAVPDRNGVPKFTERAGVFLTSEEALTFDAYFDAIVAMQSRSDEFKAKVGDRATWFRVNNKINDPVVRVGMTSDATAADRQMVGTFAPKGWRVEFWDARVGVNQVKKMYDRVYDVDERKKITSALADFGIEVTGAVYRPYEDSIEVLLNKEPSDPAAIAERLRSVGLVPGTLSKQAEPVPAAGRKASAGGAKAGIRLGGATACTSNMVLQDTTNNRWSMLIAGHCIPVATRGTAQDVTHDGVKIGSYRANSAFETTPGDTVTPIVDTALVDLDPGEQTGLLMTVGVPIHSDPDERGHNGMEYVTGWGAPNEFSGEMMCMEGASSIRDEAPYVNASAFRGRMQTVCGSEDGVNQNLNKVRWWGNGFAAGQGWGEVSCAGDSGGYLRRPGQSVALGILSRTPANRQDLVTNPNVVDRFCGDAGYFFSPFKAVQLYANQNPPTTLTAVDGLAMVKSIRNVETGNCLGRPGGNHYPGFAVVQQSCPAEWRVLPMQRIRWEPTGPYGDEVYMIEHWGICLNGVNASTVNQNACPGGPGSFPTAFEMHWRLQKAPNSSFTIRSEFFSANLNRSGSSSVVLGPNGAASRWRLG